MVVEGEQVQASLTRTGPWSARGTAVKSHRRAGAHGIADAGRRADRARRAAGADAGEGPGRAVHRRPAAGRVDRRPRSTTSMGFDEPNGNLYPFSLADKLVAITETVALVRAGRATPRGVAPSSRPRCSACSPTRAACTYPSVGRRSGCSSTSRCARHGPVFVDETYTVTHEVVALGQSKRVESYWTRDAAHRSGRHAHRDRAAAPGRVQGVLRGVSRMTSTA